MRLCEECLGSGGIFVKAKPFMVADCPYLLGLRNSSLP